MLGTLNGRIRVQRYKKSFAIQKQAAAIFLCCFVFSITVLLGKTPCYH
jgi:uncharacterized membrane protein